MAPVSASSAAPSRWATADQWDNYRHAITDLYMQKDLTLADVRTQMEEVYGFRATERMYKTRLKAWGLSKNFKHDEVLAMARVKARRDADDRSSEFWRNGRLVDYSRVEIYLRTNKLAAVQLRKHAAADERATMQVERYLPPHIFVIAPSRSLPLGDEDTAIQQICIAMRQYVLSCFARGNWCARDDVRVDIPAMIEPQVAIRDGLLASIVYGKHQDTSSFASQRRWLDRAFAAVRPAIIGQHPTLITSWTTPIVWDMLSFYKKPELIRVFLDYAYQVSLDVHGCHHPISTWLRGLGVILRSHAQGQSLMMAHQGSAVFLQAARDAVIEQGGHSAFALAVYSCQRRIEFAVDPKIDEAEKCFGRFCAALKTRDDRMLYEHHMITELIHRGQRHEALQMLYRRLEGDVPNKHTDWKIIGVIYGYWKDLPEALKAFAQSVRALKDEPNVDTSTMIYWKETINYHLTLRGFRNVTLRDAIAGRELPGEEINMLQQAIDDIKVDGS